MAMQTFFNLVWLKLDSGARLPSTGHPFSVAFLICGFQTTDQCWLYRGWYYRAIAVIEKL